MFSSSSTIRIPSEGSRPRVRRTRDAMREGDAEKKAGHLREAEMEMKVGIEIFKLNLLAYPDSADAHYNLADAYLQVGKKAPARQYAEKALAMIDSHAAPLSSWSDTEQRRAQWNSRNIRSHRERATQKGVASAFLKGRNVRGRLPLSPTEEMRGRDDLVENLISRLRIESGPPPRRTDMKWWQIKKRDPDLERELRSDLELEEEEQREGGISGEEARYAALRAFGNLTLIREQTVDVWS